MASRRAPSLPGPWSHPRSSFGSHTLILEPPSHTVQYMHIQSCPLFWGSPLSCCLSFADPDWIKRLLQSPCPFCDSPVFWVFVRRIEEHERGCRKCPGAWGAGVLEDLVRGSGETLFWLEAGRASLSSFQHKHYLQELKSSFKWLHVESLSHFEVNISHPQLLTQWGQLTFQVSCLKQLSRSLLLLET